MISAEAVRARFEMLADIRRVRGTETLNARLLTYLVFPKQLEAHGIFLVERIWALEVPSPGFKSQDCLFLFQIIGWLPGGTGSDCSTVPKGLDRDWGGAGRGGESLKCLAAGSLVI